MPLDTIAKVVKVHVAIAAHVLAFPLALIAPYAKIGINKELARELGSPGNEEPSKADEHMSSALFLLPPRSHWLARAHCHDHCNPEGETWSFSMLADELK